MTANHYCFCELAPLYALGTLSDEERSWVEQQIAQCPELAEDLAMAEQAVTVLAYSVPPLSPPQDLKQRLFQRIAADDHEPVTQSEWTKPSDSRPDEFPNLDSLGLPEKVALSALLDVLADLKWKPHQVPGVRVAPLHVNHQTRQVVSLLKAEAGIRYPLHNHAGVEEIFMLAGDLSDGDRIYRAGDYIRSDSESMHSPSTQEGCVFLVRTSLDDKILEPITKPSLTFWLSQFWQK